MPLPVALMVNSSIVTFVGSPPEASASPTPVFPALVTPLFFQVVTDKVLTHRGYTTLDVLVFGLITVTIFETVLGGLDLRDADLEDEAALLDRYTTLTGWSEALLSAGAAQVTVVHRFGRNAIVGRNGVEDLPKSWVVRETATFLLRDLRTPEGGFASSLDADTPLRAVPIMS